MLIPKDSLYGPEGKWILENYGTEPDVVVESGPDEPLSHRDLQLEAGVKAALEELKKGRSNRVQLPPLFDPYPSRGKVPPAPFVPQTHDR